ncbi:protein kinase interacting protein [Adoxophyes honmai nucleopolyhedrovirus]|uniref:Protein kinase interacting protein n=1 Tax=Adoxophyes honmai nucleopolyhedrovirus TaxID=224399 RepID=Q80LJ8_NPVAH|nr:protein kinase interacting protein [Adoxophyes honmai nucleopolyhedrovirus]BAC67349.1 protein kinase interacting protein [Adoxophyes honmai nucleopolyhedrovirus]
MSFNEKIITLKTKENNLRDQYENKVKTYLKRFSAVNDIASKLSLKQLQHDLYQLDALLFGTEEQVYFLNNSNNVAKRDLIDNVNDLDHLALSKDEIMDMIENKSIDVFLKRIPSTCQLDEDYANILNKHAKGVMKVFTEFENKRKAFIKQQYLQEFNKLGKNKNTDKLLEEVILLKSVIIKHLCIFERVLSNVMKKTVTSTRT